MLDKKNETRVLGLRGTTPVSGKDKNKYGGHTSCACLVISEGEWIIVDTGTGIKKLGEKLEFAISISLTLIPPILISRLMRLSL